MRREVVWGLVIGLLVGGGLFAAQSWRNGQHRDDEARLDRLRRECEAQKCRVPGLMPVRLDGHCVCVELLP